MITVDEALAEVLGRVTLLPIETVDLEDARRRVLRQVIQADRDFPPFHRAAMDGFAVRTADVSLANTSLTLVGEIRAGVWPDRSLGEGQAIRIMTGAPVPEGADAVVQVERTKSSGGSVLVEVTAAAGQNIVRQGAEALAGAELLPPGVRIGASHLAVLASVGAIHPSVSARPRVTVLVTGDEVIPPGWHPTAAQIRNANGPALIALIEEAGGIATEAAVVSDDPTQTQAAIQAALESGCDVVVLSGGVSAGDFDFVEGALSDLGVTLHVTSVRVKPGAPFVFGTRGRTLIFGLPGNPVSAQVTFELFVRPALLKMQAASFIARPLIEATLDGTLVNRSGRRNYLPVFAVRKAGRLVAQPIATQGSGDVVAHALANALAILEPEQTQARSGDVLTLHPLSSFLEA